MITRIWEGKTNKAHLEEYKRIIIERDIPNYRKTEGFMDQAINLWRSFE